MNFESGEEGWCGRGVRGGGSPSCLRCGVRRVGSGLGAIALVLGYVGEKTSDVESPVASGPWARSAGVVGREGPRVHGWEGFLCMVLGSQRWTMV